MTYIPKNRITTNLYTNTKELMYKDTKEFYTGFYWKSFEGKYFTGKNPNQTPRKELIKVTTPVEQPNTTQLNIDNDDNIAYANIRNINLNDIPKQIVPQHQYIKPTEDDYKLGVFDRYFLYKQNENVYLEVDKDVYKAIKGNDAKYYSTPYSTILLAWTLTGDEEEVSKINKQIIELEENRIKRKGLNQFLKGNYTKFWRPE